MKKVEREGVFETNSSSVHTLTVSERQKEEYRRFVKDDILYPDEFYKTYVKYGEFDDIQEGKLWEATTFDEKACLLFLYLNYGRLEIITAQTEYTQCDGRLVFVAINMAKNLLPYKDVCFGVESISPLVDRGDVAIDLTGLLLYPGEDTPNYKKAIEDFVHTINNNNLIIRVVTGKN